MARFKNSTPLGGFTIIELLVSVAIIGLLIALLIPNIDRSLNRNQVVNDVDLFKAKLEEVRLLSGSTQQIDEAGNQTIGDDEVGYYAVVIPGGTNDYFGIVKLSYPLSDSSQQCLPDLAAAQLDSGTGVCLIERLRLSRNVRIEGTDSDQFIAFRVPTQKMFELQSVLGSWEEGAPQFDYPNSVFELTYPGIRARVGLEDYSARVKVEYIAE